MSNRKMTALGGLAVLMIAGGVGLYAQSGRTITATPSTITSGSVWGCSDGNLCVSTSSGTFTTSLGWQGGGPPAETRKPIIPAVTISQVRKNSHKVQDSELAPASYRATARALQVNSAAIEEFELLQEIHDHALRVYDYDKVDKFLYNEALKQEENTRWVWKPLREPDLKIASANSSWRVERGMGFVYPKLYNKAVPERVLNLVADLLECVPNAVMLVSDFEVIRPDPFLAITTPTLMKENKIFIIAQWDEPSFHDAPDYPAEFLASAPHKR